MFKLKKNILAAVLCLFSHIIYAEEYKFFLGIASNDIGNDLRHSYVIDIYQENTNEFVSKVKINNSELHEVSTVFDGSSTVYIRRIEAFNKESGVTNTIEFIKPSDVCTLDLSIRLFSDIDGVGYPVLRLIHLLHTQPTQTTVSCDNSDVTWLKSKM